MSTRRLAQPEIAQNGWVMDGFPRTPQQVSQRARVGVCARVCVCVRARVCVCVCARARACVCEHARACVCVCVSVRARVRVCVRTAWASHPWPSAIIGYNRL